MDNRPTSIERAFQLAGLGFDLKDILITLKAEHLSPQQLYGPILRRQLRQLRDAAKA